MAQIKGLTIKNITNFKGHEGESCRQGNIYLNGKKVGYYSDSFMMGEATIAFDSKEHRARAEKICVEYYTENPQERWFPDIEPDIEELIQKLFELIDREKSYKRNLKKGFSVLATYKQGYSTMIVSAASLPAAYKWLKEKGVTNEKIYQSLNDFNIK